MGSNQAPVPICQGSSVHSMHLVALAVEKSIKGGQTLVI